MKPIKVLIPILGLSMCALSLSSQATLITDSHSAAFNFDTFLLALDNNPEPFKVGADPNTRTKKTHKQTVSITQFDSTLGTLQAVNIWFDSTWSLTSTVRSFDTKSSTKTASGRGKSISNQTVSLFIDPDKEVIKNHEVIVTKCKATDFCQEEATETGLFSDSFDLGAFTLTDFIGLDFLDFTVRRFLVADLLKCGKNDSCWERNNNNAWAGNIHVDYTYDTAAGRPTNVPEPSSLLLMSLGFIGLGASRLRRRL